MKRSKLFLGITACVLGVAAFAASKAKFVTNSFYTKIANTQVCDQTPISGTKYYTTAHTGHPVTVSGVYATKNCLAPTYFVTGTN